MSAPDDLLFEDAACGLLLTQVDGTILKANRTFCGWLGQDKSAVVGKKLTSFLTVGARMFHQTHWLPLMEMQGTVSEVKLDFRCGAGEKVPMVVNARALALPDGGIAHSIAAFVATDRDRYERELLSARSEAEGLLRQRMLLQQESDERSVFAEQLIGIVSHDLRNPLTAIRMGTEMLSLDELDAKRLRLCTRIDQSVDRALSLVEDLFDFTLTRTGRSLVLQKKNVDFHEVIAQALEELRWAFPKVEIQHESQGSGRVEVDAERIVRALGNLVANAARYGDNTHPIVVKSKITPEGAGLQVCNAGPPIPADLMPSLFQPMTRGESQHGGGVGLGLYIVSQIAIAHGGRTTAASDTDSGTRMGIELPFGATSSTFSQAQSEGQMASSLGKEQK